MADNSNPKDEQSIERERERSDVGIKGAQETGRSAGAPIPVLGERRRLMKKHEGGERGAAVGREDAGKKGGGRGGKKEERNAFQ
ncbi:hypothetical protein KM043_011230 [Ampulex compressa]|nr:hypothetical protein KM043_011230 [Ampulex compressa]